MVAKSDNSETFVGLCLLTVAGASLLTQQLGFSDTLGAFAAGVLLSESNFKTQAGAARGRALLCARLRSARLLLWRGLTQGTTTVWGHMRQQAGEYACWTTGPCSHPHLL